MSNKKDEIEIEIIKQLRTKKPNWETSRIKIASGGISIESGTFSPLKSKREDFRELRGAEMVSQRYPFMCKPDTTYSNIDIYPLVHFRAMPGGQVQSDAYAWMKHELLSALKHLMEHSLVLPDVLYLDVHGAMTVEGIDDAEFDLLSALTQLLPLDTLVTCSQDLHGNLSPKLFSLVDFITTYRTAPHIDVLLTRERAFSLVHRAFA